MSGYYKLIWKDDSLAVLDIVGWKGRAVALQRDRVERMIKQIEAVQDHVEGDGHRLAHALWEEFSFLLSYTQPLNDETSAS